MTNTAKTPPLSRLSSFSRHKIFTNSVSKHKNAELAFYSIPLKLGHSVERCQKEQSRVHIFYLMQYFSIYVQLSECSPKQNEHLSSLVYI